MEEIAQVYARALFDVAVERDALDEIRDQLGAFADAMHESHDLAVFFFSPYFSVPEKKDGLKRTVQDADPAVVNFLEALIERHRMPAIFRIRTDFDAMWEKERRRLPARLLEALAVFGQQLIGLRAGALGGVDRVLDRLLAPVQRFGDAWEGVLLQREHREAEQQQRPDHQADVGRDQE